MISSEMLFNAPYMMIHPPATGPERNDRENQGQVVQVDGLNEARVPEPLQDEDTGLTEGLSTKSQA